MVRDCKEAFLITGASAGIGLSFARAFARRGKNVVLVARNKQKLAKAAHMLTEKHDIAAIAIAADLANPETPTRLLRETSDMGIEVTGLVNNAGFGVPGRLCEVEWDRHRDTIEVMVTAPVHLTRMFAPSMIRRRHGKIINVASLSALLPPHAGGTLYYPVKSFLYQFSLATHDELVSSGVHVTAVCPGFTETNFQNAAGGTVESVTVPRWMWSKPDDVVKAALAASDRNRAVCIPGVANKAIALAFKLIPTALGRRIVRA